ncbi:hypothetical protein GCM10027203_69650 [Nonomuraea fastidiosa]
MASAAWRTDCSETEQPSERVLHPMGGAVSGAVAVAAASGGDNRAAVRGRARRAAPTLVKAVLSMRMVLLVRRG